jgi:O-antigen ligase
LAGAVALLLWARLFNGQTLALRFDGWAATLRLWRDYPLAGVGPGGFFWRYPAYLPAGIALEPNQLHPHNIWLEVAATWGLLGILWFAAIIVAAIGARPRQIRSAAANGWLAAGLAAAFVAAVAHAQVDAFFLLPDLAAWNAIAWALLSSTRD